MSSITTGSGQKPSSGTSPSASCYLTQTWAPVFFLAHFPSFSFPRWPRPGVGLASGTGGVEHCSRARLQLGFIINKNTRLGAAGCCAGGGEGFAGSCGALWEHGTGSLAEFRARATSEVSWGWLSVCPGTALAATNHPSTTTNCSSTTTNCPSTTVCVQSAAAAMAPRCVSGAGYGAGCCARCCPWTFSKEGTPGAT